MPVGDVSMQHFIAIYVLIALLVALACFCLLTCFNLKRKTQSLSDHINSDMFQSDNQHVIQSMLNDPSTLTRLIDPIASKINNMLLTRSRSPSQSNLHQQHDDNSSMQVPSPSPKEVPKNGIKVNGIGGLLFV
jgi:hypothetical protein